MTRHDARKVALESVREGYRRSYGIPSKYKTYITVRETARGLVVTVDVGALAPDEAMEVIKCYRECVKQHVFDNMTTFQMNLRRQNDARR